jgi:hypothetical protein
LQKLKTKKIMKNLLISMLAIAASISATYAQSNCCTNPSKTPINLEPAVNTVNYADVRIMKAEVKLIANELNFTAIVQNNTGNNSAYNTKAVVILPGANILNFEAKMDGKPLSVVQCNGTLIIDIGMLNPQLQGSNFVANSQVTIFVKASLIQNALSIGGENFGIFVYSETPDKLVSDNYWYWKSNTEMYKLGK